MNKNRRNPTYELLRVIAMYLIVINHYAMFIPIDFSNHPYNTFLNCFMQTGGKFGVNIFVFITGYFMCTSTFHLYKLLSLLTKCLIYSLGCYVVCSIIVNEISIIDFIKACFPIITNEYWFMTAYVGVYIFCPYINKLFYTLDSNQRKELTIILTIMFSVIPTFTLQETWTSNFVWLIYLYWLGAYIRTDLPENVNKSKYLLSTSIFLYIGIATSIIGIEYISNYIPVLSYHINHFRNMTSFPLLLSSILFFIWFGKKSINKESKVVSIILILAKGAFAVCLIHENPFVKQYLWGEWLIEITPKGFLYLPFTIVISLFIYVLCTIIDIVISKFIDNINFSKLSKVLLTSINKK